MSSNTEKFTPVTNDSITYDINSNRQVGQITHLSHHAPLSPFQARIERFVEKYGGETIGVQRLAEEDRDVSQKPISTFFFWTAINFSYAGLATGSLGPLLFGLGWWDSFLTVIFFLMLSSILVGLMSSIGPVLGMRTMVITRYSFGSWPSKVIIFINAITCICWLVINTIAAGDLLFDASDGRLPLTASIIIVLVLSAIASLFGYQTIHTVDKYCWIVVTFTFVIIIGFGSKHFVNVPMATGSAARLGVLSYGALVFSWMITWFSLAADYSLYMPSSTPKYQVFLWTCGGCVLGTVVGFLCGIAFATLVSNPDPKYGFPAVYDDRGIAGLVGAVFEGYSDSVRGFGRFIEVLLALSVIAANIASMYSFGITVLALSKWTQRIPRILVTCLGFAIALIVSLVLRNHFVETLQNFVDMLSYWCTPFAVIVLAEHFIIRPTQHLEYDTSVWDIPSKLPPGIAALVAWSVGLVCGILGADQTWYEGPIAKAIGGADVGFEFSALALVVYIPARLLEIKVFGR